MKNTPNQAGSDGASEACAGAAVRRRVREILLAEFAYWNDDQPGDDEAMSAIRMGATGAVSNVLAALTGRPAAWHPQHNSEKPATPPAEVS